MLIYMINIRIYVCVCVCVCLYFCDGKEYMVLRKKAGKAVLPLIFITISL